MPNYVKTVIHFSDDFNMEAFNLKYIHKNDRGDEQVDFNDLIPMPQGIRDSESSSSSRSGFILILAAKSPLCKTTLDGVAKLGEKEWLSLMDRVRKPLWGSALYQVSPLTDEIAHQALASFGGDADELAKGLRLGQLALDNAVAYGACDWYDWARKHWGTKWNAMDACASDGDARDKSVEFQTAWTHPFPVVAELSRRLPGENILVEWADEDEGGGNSGAYLIRGGAVVERWAPYGEDDCVDFSEHVWNDAGYRDFALDRLFRILRPARA